MLSAGFLSAFSRRKDEEGWFIPILLTCLSQVDDECAEREGERERGSGDFPGWIPVHTMPHHAVVQYVCAATYSYMRSTVE